MQADIEFADAQTYIQHFRNKGCDTDIGNNRSELLNLCWYNVKLIDDLKLELEKKTVNIVRLNEIVFGPGDCSETDTSKDEGDAESTDSNPETDSEAPDEEDQQQWHPFEQRPDIGDIACEEGLAPKKYKQGDGSETTEEQPGHGRGKEQGQFFAGNAIDGGITQHGRRLPLH